MSAAISSLTLVKISRTKEITRLRIISTVQIQNKTKKSRGQLLPITVQYMLVVTYQLLTIITWNKVTKLDAKSLKFSR